MGHGEEVSNAQYFDFAQYKCPMPEAAGRLSLSTPLAGWSFPPLSMNCFTHLGILSPENIRI
ncbi:hypothetical protein [Nostoc sp. CHAB 5715]|uniref:hypothetical protein n=1 Tax=Nostoc sp. CHAB 5715 TaxID=2780400 RepID=UPI001E583144|nr:hypothetical protein [Nostoc sp. CHAB 5715]MCC5624536.1 hypothetical protein [Nostoc sp. CHAB 5715]